MPQFNVYDLSEGWKAVSVEKSESLHERLSKRAIQYYRSIDAENEEAAIESAWKCTVSMDKSPVI